MLKKYCLNSMRIILSSLKTDLNVKNFAHCIREKLTTRLLTHKHEVADKFSKWTVIYPKIKYFHDLFQVIKVNHHWKDAYDKQVERCDKLEVDKQHLREQIQKEMEGSSKLREFTSKRNTDHMHGICNTDDIEGMKQQVHQAAVDTIFKKLVK